MQIIIDDFTPAQNFDTFLEARKSIKAFLHQVSSHENVSACAAQESN